MATASSAAASTAVPVHPYWPQDADIPGYLPNTITTPMIFAIFGSSLAAVLVPTALHIRRARPGLPTSEFLTVMWFVACAAIHMVLEGYYAYNFNDIASSPAVLAQLWKEYALSDSRYLSRDSFMMPMEGTTAFVWGPLSAVIAWCIVTGHPLRHPLQLLVSTGQLYGTVLYYATFHFQERVWGVEYCRPEASYFWLYYFAMNFVWFAIASVLVVSSVRASARAFAALDGAAKKGKAAGKKSVS